MHNIPPEVVLVILQVSSKTRVLERTPFTMSGLITNMTIWSVIRNELSVADQYC